MLPFLNTRRKRRDQVRLPIELWARIFSHLRAPKDIFVVAQVCKAWHREVLSPLSASLWRSVWDHRSGVSADTIDHLFPHQRLGGGWLKQVQASCRLASADGGPRSSIYLPPRYTTSGTPIAADELEMRPHSIDIEETLGRAVCAHAFSTDASLASKRASVSCASAPTPPLNPPHEHACAHGMRAISILRTRANRASSSTTTRRSAVSPASRQTP